LGVRKEGSYLYADDIVLLASLGIELQAILDIVSLYAKQWRFVTNHGKSNVGVIGSRALLPLAARFWVDYKTLSLPQSQITHAMHSESHGA
jgi:hypothetical protein